MFGVVECEATARHNWELCEKKQNHPCKDADCIDVISYHHQHCSTVIVKLFALFLCISASGSAGGAFYDDEQFVLPVKLFIGDFLHRHVCYYMSLVYMTCLCNVSFLCA